MKENSETVQAAFSPRPYSGLRTPPEKVYLVTVDGTADPAKKINKGPAPFYQNRYFPGTFTLHVRSEVAVGAHESGERRPIRALVQDQLALFSLRFVDKVHFAIQHLGAVVGMRRSGVTFNRLQCWRRVQSPDEQQRSDDK